tara:strand:+ start:71 stop:1000 length:930 start_codon:yes stop_codon:yes gene_type:complete
MNFIIYASLCVLSAYYAKEKGKDFFKFLLASFFLSPIIVFVYLLLTKTSVKKPSTQKWDYDENDDDTFFNRDELKTGNKRETKEANSVYSKSLLYFDVKGVFAESSRIKVFKNLKKGDKLILDTNVYNEHDKYAISILNENNKMLGFIPKGNRKLHRTLNSNIDSICSVYSKEEYYSDYHEDYQYLMTAKIYVGFNENDISLIRNINNNFSTFLINYQEKKYKDNIELCDSLANDFIELLKNKSILNKFKQEKISFDIDFDKISINLIRAKEADKCLVIFDVLNPLLKETNMWKDGRFKKLTARLEKLK